MTVLCSAYRKPDKYIIQAEKDAYFHNNLGIRYLEDRIYYAAIQEFKIAINLSRSKSGLLESCASLNTRVLKRNQDNSRLMKFADLFKVLFDIENPLL